MTQANLADLHVILPIQRPGFQRRASARAKRGRVTVRCNSLSAAPFLRAAAGAPRRRPAELRSSSTSGQWIPKPPAEIRQLPRCSAVAWSSRGNQASGTLIVLPSARSTLRVSSETRTSFTRSPGLGSKVLIPCLEQQRLILADRPLDLGKLACGEAEVSSQSDRQEPKLGRRIITVHVNVRLHRRG